MKWLIIFTTILALVCCCQKEEIPDLIETTTGESFEIELEANWSTGYHWSWINKGEINIADTTGLVFVPDNPSLGGSSGIEKWSFMAVEPGDQTLIFRYISPGNLKTDPGATREIRVVVEE